MSPRPQHSKEARLAAVTGAAGFVGRPLVDRLLADGWTVRVLSRTGRWTGAPVEVFQGVLGSDSPETLAGFTEGVDVLFHCAGEVRDAAKMEAVNVHGTQALLQAARGRVGRWVQLSSVGVYGPLAAGTFTEETPYNPQGVYEITKLQADEDVLSAAARGLQAVILRPSIIFGADMPNASLRQMATLLRRDLFFYMGAPMASANYVHIADVVDALVLCAEVPAAAGRIFNLSAWTTIEGFVSAMAAGMGRPAPRLRLPKGLALLAASVLAWLPRFPLTRHRIGALTSRTRYSAQALVDTLGFTFREPLEDSIGRIAAEWSRL